MQQQQALAWKKSGAVSQQQSYYITHMQSTAPMLYSTSSLLLLAADTNTNDAQAAVELVGDALDYLVIHSVVKPLSYHLGKLYNSTSKKVRRNWRQIRYVQLKAN